MVVQCCVDGCKTTLYGRTNEKHDESKKMHRFPRAEDRFNQWLNNVRRANGPDWFPNNVQTARICSRHFANEYYELERQDGLKKLRWNAVPTLFDDDAIQREEKTQRSILQKGKRKRQNLMKHFMDSSIDHLTSTDDFDFPTLFEGQPIPAPVIDEDSSQKTSQKEKKKRQNLLKHFMDSSVDPVPSTDDVGSLHEDESDIRDYITLGGYQIDSSEDNVAATDAREMDMQEERETGSTSEGGSTSQDANGSTSSTPQEMSAFQSFVSNELQQIIIKTEPGDEIPPNAVVENIVEMLPSNTPSHFMLGGETDKSSYTESEIDKLQIKQLTEYNRKLQGEIQRLKAFTEKVIKQNQRLRHSNTLTSKAYRDLKKNYERSHESLKKHFNEDQIKALTRKSTRGGKWSNETIREALKLRRQCGSTGYKAIAQKLPYPSIRTLQNFLHEQKADLEGLEIEPEDLEACENDDEDFLPHIQPQNPANSAANSGTPGNPGTAGNTGNVGNTGTIGNTGPVGNTGTVGNTGPVANTGPVGNTGPLGNSVAVGNTGTAGNTGMGGNAGMGGTPGIAGNVGMPGPSGMGGPAGIPGTTGMPISAGPAGLAGPPGIGGPIGMIGPPGIIGPPGLGGTPGLGGPGQNPPNNMQPHDFRNAIMTPGGLFHPHL